MIWKRTDGEWFYTKMQWPSSVSKLSMIIKVSARDLKSMKILPKTVGQKF